MFIELVAHGLKKLIYKSNYGVMIKDENGTLHPETVEDEVQLREKRERFEKNWNRKARREGWARPELNQGAKPEKEETRLDRAFRKKFLNEHWDKD